MNVFLTSEGQDNIAYFDDDKTLLHTTAGVKQPREIRGK